MMRYTITTESIRIMFLFLNVVVAIATSDPFCAVVKQEYRALPPCCPQSDAPPVDATRASVAIANMAASLGTCLGKGLAYETFTASEAATELYISYDASPYFEGLQASLRLAEGKQVPKNFVNCPGMMIMISYISGWLKAPPPRELQTTPCSSGLVTALQVMQDIFGAETSLGINLVTPEGAALWVKVFTDLTNAVVTTQQHQYSQAWVNALFTKMQSIDDLPDSLVGVLIATMFTHVQIVGGLQGITYTAPLSGKWAFYATNDQTAVSVNPVVALNDAYNNLYGGSGGEALYNSLSTLAEATCTMCHTAP